MDAAWTIASIELGIAQIRSGCLLRAVLDNEGLRGLLLSSAPDLAMMPRHRLADDLPAIMQTGREDVSAAPGATSPKATEPRNKGNREATPALDAYTLDLTMEARNGRIDPIVAREPEIRQIIDILMRRRQNNPILTGDAGVGKTAVVEGFALRVAEGDVPPPLRERAVRALDLGVAAGGRRGEGRIRESAASSVIAGGQVSPTPIILFIDEAHTMIGAGGQAGQRRCGQPAEAGAGARRTAHHRGDHLDGIQEILRKGSRPGSAFPGGKGGGAHRSGDGRACCAASSPEAGEASRAAHSR